MYACKEWPSMNLDGRRMQPTSAPLPSRCPCCALWPGEPVGCSPMDDRRPTPSDLWSHVPDARAVLCCRGAREPPSGEQCCGGSEEGRPKDLKR